MFHFSDFGLETDLIVLIALGLIVVFYWQRTAA